MKVVTPKFAVRISIPNVVVLGIKLFPVLAFELQVPVSIVVSDDDCSSRK